MQPRATLDRCAGCGRLIETHRLFCTACGRPIGPRTRPVNAREYRPAPRMPAWPFLVGGPLIGGSIGFWLRPAVAFGKKLSFATVMMRGANLHDVDAALVNTAEASFNRLLLGVAIGAVLGLCLIVAIRRML